MKGTNPVIPPGINFEGAKRGRSNMRVAVIVVVLLHIALFTGILFNACKQKDTDEGARKTTAEEMAQIVALQPDPSPLAKPSTPEAQSLPPLPDNGNSGLPPLPPTGGATPPPGDSLGLLPAPVTPPPAQPTQPLLLPASTEHVVASGDSFWTIGRKYGVSSSAIEQANPNVIPTRMKIGQKIIIPAKLVSPPTPTPTNDGAGYTVKSGDTLGHIALKHGMKVDDLKAANPNVIPTRMKIGQKLKLPGSADGSSAFPGSGPSASPPVDPVTGLPILPPPSETSLSTP